MPNLLAKLEAEVLVVNPYANTASVLTFDRPAAAARVAELVRASGAHLGAVLDPGGEFVDIVDDQGHTLSHDEALLVLRHPGHRVGARCPDRPAGGGQRGRRADLPGRRRRDRLDQAVGRRT